MARGFNRYTNNNVGQFVIPLITIVGCAVLAFAANQFPDYEEGVGGAGPDLFPLTVITVLLVASIGRFVAELRSRPGTDIGSASESAAIESAATATGERPTGPENTVQWRRRQVRVVGTVLMTILYIVLLERLGFVVSSFLYAWALGVLIDSRRRYVRAAAVAALLVGTAYGTFGLVLQATLPRGVLF